MFLAKAPWPRALSCLLYQHPPLLSHPLLLFKSKYAASFRKSSPQRNRTVSHPPIHANAQIVFFSPTFIGLTADYAYAHKLQEQQQFQLAEDNVCISGLLSLDHVLLDSFDTLGHALLSLPEPSTGQNYLIRSIETDKFDLSVLFYFCTHFANKSYIESLVETLYPTPLLQHYPALTSADVWHNPGLHTTTVTLDELVSSSTTELDSLLCYSPFSQLSLRDLPAQITNSLRSRPTSKSSRGGRGTNNRSRSTTFQSPTHSQLPSSPSPRNSGPPSVSGTTLSTHVSSDAPHLLELTSNIALLKTQVDDLSSRLNTSARLLVILPHWIPLQSPPSWTPN